jgi:hypothetical protein
MKAPLSLVSVKTTFASHQCSVGAELRDVRRSCGLRDVPLMRLRPGDV